MGVSVTGMTPIVSNQAPAMCTAADPELLVAKAVSKKW